jgi:hypothetical protein
MELIPFIQDNYPSFWYQLYIVFSILRSASPFERNLPHNEKTHPSEKTDMVSRQPQGYHLSISP